MELRQACTGFVNALVIAQGLAALESAFDAIFSDPALRALVIDVRINFGESDPYGLAVASRLELERECEGVLRC